VRKLICVLIGYLLGCWNPAARLGKKKQVDLRQEGTKNLGASNVTLVLGKKYGFAVMVLDILYGNGTFRLLGEQEKVTANLIMLSDVLPEE
jgi:glycerol-3-phosphate acyltransferase PlsY